MQKVTGSTPVTSTNPASAGFLMNIFRVYIIYSCSLDKYYVGYTTDLEKRLADHNTGISTFTSKAADWELKFSETYPSRELAMLRERQIKRKKSRKYVEWLINSTK